MLTREAATLLMKGAAVDFDLQPKWVATRSIRISGATALLMAGVPPETVQIMGRWVSNAFIRTPGVPKTPLVLGGKHLRSKINFRIYPIRVVFRLKRSPFSEIFRKIYKGDLKLRGCKYWTLGWVALATAPGPYSANNFLN